MRHATRLDMVPPYIRYVAVSAIALGIDSVTFLALIASDIPAVTASGIGYACGIVAHWALSSRAVFADRLSATQSGRRRQQILFVASALVGLAITMSIVGIGSALGLDPRFAKLIAIAVSFQTTWLARRRVVFA